MTHVLIVLLAASAVVVGCAAQTRPPNDAPNSLHAQLADEWKYWMAEYPEIATAFGNPGQNARWTDYSQLGIDARADYLKKSLDRLKGISREQLQAEDQ